MRGRLLIVVPLLALLVSGAALAGRGDPRERLTPVDQKRARAMLLRPSDFGLAYRAIPPSSRASGFYCAALDESRLTITGKGQSPTFQGGVEFASSLSRVYRTAGEATTAWGLGTTPAGEACARKELESQFRTAGTRVVSFARMPFPRFAERSQRYRVVVESQGVRAFVDAIALKKGRAVVGLVLGSGLTPMPTAEEIRLTRSVARRMASAMKGSQSG
jgi:hypothetical protein